MQKKKKNLKQNLDQAGCKYTGKNLFFMLHLSAKLRKSYLQVTKNPIIMSLEE